MTSDMKETIDQLGEACAQEQARFAEGLASQGRACFELFRHALEHNDTAAFTYVYRTYEPQVRHWVYRHPRYPAAQEEADFFVQQALTKFYFALRGKSFDRFEHLAQVMSYLKLCVHSAIMQYWRRIQAQRTHIAGGDNRLDTIPVKPTTMTAMDAWSRITELITDPREQRLAHFVFVQSLKPAEVVAHHSSEWPEVREVYSTLYRLRRLLRNDPLLRQLLLGPSEHQ